MRSFQRIVAAIAITWIVACGGKHTTTTTTSGGGGTGGSDDGAGAGGSQPGVGQLCGTRGAGECPAPLFCNFEPGQECGATDKGGHCAAKPAACPRIAAPVCGCDGKTYGNGCEASAAGVGVKQTGKCTDA
jgi:hypothetical protein